MKSRTYRIPPRVKGVTSWRFIPLPSAPKWAMLPERVSVDWDDCSPTLREVNRRLRALGCYKTLYRVRWRASSSGNGVHLLVSYPAHVPAYRLFHKREQWGDDPVRLKYDAYRYAKTGDPLYAHGFLFDGKLVEGRTFRAGPWVQLREDEES